MDLVAQVLRAIEEHPVVPVEFERCACALLQVQYPALSAVEGGHDFGRDADIYFPSDERDQNSRGRLLVTTGDPVANLRNGLKRMVEEGLRVDLVVMACLQAVSARTQAKLDELCREYGFPAPHVYSRDWFVNALVKEPDWRQRLLGVGGQLEALLRQPLGLADTAPELMGRQSELTMLRAMVDGRADLIVVGVPGVGKTRLTVELGEKVLFLETSEPGQVLDGVVRSQPAGIVVDDAHARAVDLRVLRRIRTQENLSFSIIATTWPDLVEDVRVELPGAQLHTAGLLERSDMDALVRAVGVTGHRARWAVLNQAEGRPGWALALCEVLIRGDSQDIVRGSAHLANVERYLRRVTESQTALDALACIAALGIVSSETAYRLAPLIGVPPAELTGLLDRLAQHGLLDRSHGGWSLQPSLRAPLVARWFFVEPTRRPWVTLLQAFPDYHRTLAIAVIAAAHTGSTAARMAAEDVIGQLPTQVSPEEIDFGLLSEYASLDEQAARHAVAQARAALLAPRSVQQIGGVRFDPVGRSAAVLLNGAAQRWLLPEAVSTLLDQAMGDTRPRHSPPEHPLRVLGDLAGMIDPDLGTSVEVRERLLTTTLNWITANPEPDRWTVAAEMLAKLFSPEVSGTWPDPGSLNTISFSQGYDTAAHLRRLLDLWPRVDDLLSSYRGTCPPEALCPLVDLVSDWFRLAAGAGIGTTDLHPEQRHAGRIGARRILETIRPAVEAVPGLAARAQRALDQRPRDDHDDEVPPASFELDPDLVDLMGGTRDPEADIDAWLRARNNRLNQVAGRITALGPDAGTARFVDLAYSVRLADHAPDGHAAMLARRMAPLMEDPVGWVRVAIRDHVPALLHAALHQALANPETLATEDLTPQLCDPDFRPAIVSAALGRADVDEFTEWVINDLDVPDAALLGRWLPLDAAGEVHHRLLTHPEPAVAAAAALTFAIAQPYGPALPAEWRDDWRAAIRGMRVDNMNREDRWRADELLGHLANDDPDLFEHWFTGQLDDQKTAGRLRPPEPDGCTDALPRLPREHRERLARTYAGLLHLPRFGVNLLSKLLGEDRELAERLLDENVITTENLLEAITGQRGTVLEQLGPLLLDHGVNPADIAAHAGLLLGARFGPASSHHEHLLTFFEDLRERKPALRVVAEAGLVHQAALRDKAKEEERQERIRGL